jgi:hypothetical protein
MSNGSKESTYAQRVHVRLCGGKGRMSSLIHTLEICPSLSGTLRCLEKCLVSIALTARGILTDDFVSSVSRVKPI